MADDGEKGLETARAENPELIILDVMLPGLNGFEVLRTLRSEGRAMPIIVLSARTGEMDKVTGLELGAEDYVAKPFRSWRSCLLALSRDRRSGAGRPRCRQLRAPQLRRRHGRRRRRGAGRSAGNEDRRWR